MPKEIYLRPPPASAQAFIDHPLTIGADLLVLVAGVYTTVILPLMVSAVARKFALSTGAAAYVASCEMGGVAVGALIAGLQVGCSDRRKWVWSGAALATAVNLLAATVDSYPLLLALRSFAGVGGGIVTAAAAAALGDTSKPDRNFALFVSLAFVAASVGFRVFPAVVYPDAVAFLFFVLAIINAAAGIAAVRLPRRPAAAFRRDAPPGEATNKSSQAALPPAALIGLGGILAYYLGVGSVWPMMDSIGSAVGVGPVDRTTILSQATIAAMCGALLAAGIATRFGRLIPMIAGFLTVCGSLAWLLVFANASVFYLATLAFLFSWNFTVPYMLGSLAMLDGSGRAVAINMTLQYVGFACGPIVGAALVARFGIWSVVLLGALGCSVSLVLFVSALVNARRLELPVLDP